MSNSFWSAYRSCATSTSSPTLLRATSTAPRSTICAENVARGIGFASLLTNSTNRMAAESGIEVRAWCHGSASRYYPFNVSMSLEGTGIAIITRSWTRTQNHYLGFYPSREGYGSRNSRSGRMDQFRSFSNYLRSSGQFGFLVAELERPDGKAHFVPWPIVEECIEIDGKVPLECIERWPFFSKGSDGYYAIDFEIIRAVLTTT